MRSFGFDAHYPALLRSTSIFWLLQIQQIYKDTCLRQFIGSPLYNIVAGENYEHLGRNPGINGWQICQPVTINMCTSFCEFSRVPCTSWNKHPILHNIHYKINKKRNKRVLLHIMELEYKYGDTLEHNWGDLRYFYQNYLWKVSM
jgi:hypothetical protein